MAYFPFMIQLDDKQCLIVGGGAVAARKAAQMCEFGACVTVVAPEICAELLAIADTERIDETAGIVENIDGNCQKKPERIRVWKREVTEADISGMDVVIMATDDAELNSQYAELCRSKHILVNVVDVKKDCDFYFPAIIKQGEVVVSVSTGGNSPMLASKIKKDIRQTLRTDYGQIADELGAIREKILAEEPDERARKRRFAAIVEAKMQEQRIRIGTRGSKLAQIQTDMVIEQLKKHYPDVRFEKVIVTTKGDKQKEAAISSFGGKAVEKLPYLWSTSYSTRAFCYQVAVAKGINPKEFNGELLYKMAEEGDTVVLDMLEDFYFTTAKYLFNIFAIVDPDIILLGGGISAQPAFVEGVKRYVEKLKFISMITNFIKVDVCKFGNDSNLLGALYSFRQMYLEN